MKKLIVFAGVLFALTAILESCGSSNKIPRPQVHPRPPKKMTMVMPSPAQQTAVQSIG